MSVKFISFPVQGFRGRQISQIYHHKEYEIFKEDVKYVTFLMTAKADGGFGQPSVLDGFKQFKCICKKKSKKLLYFFCHKDFSSDHVS